MDIIIRGQLEHYFFENISSSKSIVKIKKKLVKYKNVDTWCNDKFIFCNVIQDFEKIHDNNDEVMMEKQKQYINCIDNLQLLSIRNFMFEYLLHQQNRIDEYIEDTVLSSRKIQNKNKDDKDFIFFCIWLDTSIRITNVANRTQGTCKMKLPSVYRYDNDTVQEKTVAQLIYNGGKSENGFSRLFYLDKLGMANKQPSIISLGKRLSWYVACLIYISKKRDSKYTNNTILFPIWKNTKSYVTHFKEFIVTDMCLPKYLIPFPGSVRKISEVFVAFQCGFNREEMDKFGLLSRHSVGTIETNYLIWTKLTRARLDNIKHHFAICDDVEKTHDGNINKDVWEYIHDTFGIQNKPIINIYKKGIDYKLLSDTNKLNKNICVNIKSNQHLPKCLCGKQVKLLKHSEEKHSESNVFYDYCINCEIIYEIHRIEIPIQNHKECYYLIDRNRSKNKVKQNTTNNQTIDYENIKIKNAKPKLYLGIDISKHGLCLCSMDIKKNNKNIIHFYYWSKDKTILKNKTIENFEFRFTKFQQTKFNIQTQQLKSILLKKINGLNYEVSLCVEESLKPSLTVSEAQTQLVAELLDDIKIIRNLKIVEKNIKLIRKIWGRTSIIDDQKVPDLETLGDCMKTTGFKDEKRKKLVKIEIYLLWLKNGFIQLIDQVNIKTRCVSVEDLIKKYKNVYNHPISDICDSAASAMYILVLDMFGSSSNHKVLSTEEPLYTELATIESAYPDSYTEEPLYTELATIESAYQDSYTDHTTEQKYYIIESKGDGTCLFHSIVSGLKQNKYIKFDTGHALRQHYVEYVLNNWDESITEDILNKETMYVNGYFYPDTKDDFKIKYGRGEWGTGHDMFLMCNMLNIMITVHTKKDNKIHSIVHDIESNLRHVLNCKGIEINVLWKNNIHYDYLLPIL